MGDAVGVTVADGDEVAGGDDEDVVGLGELVRDGWETAKKYLYE